MKKTFIILGIVAAAVLILIVWPVSAFIGTYNKTVSMEQKTKEAWAQVENVYQRRLDLIPNLVNTVKGVANFEKETLTGVIEARAKATQVTIDPTKMTAANFKQFEEAQGRVSSSLSRLLVTMEQYPQLRATESFKELQSQLEGTENRIATERRRFNEVIMEYNAYIKKLVMPTIVAGFRGLTEKPYFSADKGAEKAPTVQF